MIEEGSYGEPETAHSHPASGNALLADRPDWTTLRKLSLLPGGFGSRREDIWPQLLLATTLSPTTEYTKGTTDISKELSAEPSPHPDERQIQLDTERSFVLYPVDGTKDKDLLQAELHDLLVAIFRRRPKLSYFQGYHDIITVLFLTLPPCMQLSCAEKLSLQRVRDSMCSSLEPVLGLLRIMKNLLRLADPTYADLLERSSPLPYYALSNLLTLFSHDMPSFPLIQHVFDYLLCRPPIMTVYLATAIVLSRKEEVERLEEEGEEGMVHSLLSGLPNIYDEEPSVLVKEHLFDDIATKTSTEDPDITRSGENAGGNKQGSSAPVDSEFLEETAVNQETTSADLSRLSDHSPVPETDGSVDSGMLHALPRPGEELTPAECVPENLHQPNTPEDPHDSAFIEENIEDDKWQHPVSSSPSYHRRTSVSLTTLLTHADLLYKLYPPTHFSITLSTIMGPQSTIFTWSEHPADMPDDDEAERMVDKPELIVRPHVEVVTKEEDIMAEKRKRRRNLQKSPFGKVERRTMVAGAILVLGVAVAVYGVRTRGPGLFQNSEHGKDWRRFGRWISGVLARGYHD